MKNLIQNASMGLCTRLVATRVGALIPISGWSNSILAAPCGAAALGISGVVF